MGGEGKIPCLDFSGEAMDEESEAWKALSSKVREACETHGCFLVEYSKISVQLSEAMFMGMKRLFDLPEDTKKKHNSTLRFNGYFCSPFSSIHESFGINGAHQLQLARAFTNLMWPPHGNPSFCEVLNSMSSKMMELNLIILKMVYESFGLENYSYGLQEENNTGNFRLIKYKVPISNDPTIGLIPHTDKNFLTILSQNEVQGLEVMSKEGNWIQLSIPNGCFMVIVGDSLKAWSNGRVHAAKHRVMMKGQKERYSCGLFLSPREDLTIEVPEKLVDQHHPLLYRPFTYSDFLNFYTSNLSDQALELFAGV